VDILGHPNLAVTYANDELQDGAGAQLQRIYGVYALSRALGVPYVHSPIEHLGYHGLLALENNAPSEGLLSECNRVFDIPSDVEVPETRVVREMRDADAGAIEAIKGAGRNGGRFQLIRICFPYPVTDRDPETYRCVKAISPFPYRRSPVFRLAVHVRRGDLYAVARDRMLPNSYYVACVLRFQEVLGKLGIPAVCELYTEVPTKQFEVTPHHHGISERISETMTYHPDMNHLEDFDSVPDLEWHVNTDPIDTLRRMATADALVLSPSSFSYVAALLSQSCIVIYHPFWHSAMKEWLISGADGTLPERELADRLESWKQATQEP
jgi:hypothetical protein